MAADITVVRRTSALLCWLGVILCGPAPAVTVHTWLDADGVRHYADNPPPDPAVGVDVIEFAAAPLAPTDGEQDFYSITNQWARLRAEREADAERELERARVRAEQRANSMPPVPPPVGYQRGFPAYVPYGAIGYRERRAPGYGRGRDHAPDRGAYLNDRRRRGFSPTPTPSWPRER